ncbi:MAG: DegT/DnrJ/EryC1/StrS family aminotransferase [Pseudomonadota bacterium]
MRKDLLIFGAPQIHDDEINEVAEVVRSGWLGTGPKVHQFEADFARYTGAPYAAAVNSCTAALHLALIAAGVGPGDEVVTTPMTFCASVNSIIHTGATPVLADIDRDTLNIDPDAVKAAITPRTRAILPVHFAGRLCDMTALMALADAHDLKVIEDCAHAIETTVDGVHAGTIGDFGCFSFYVTKNVITGEGGMVTARNEEHHERIKRLALHGMSRDAWKRFGSSGYSHYQVVECGFKYNMMDLQAAIGLHQLRRVEDNWRRREQIWHQYLDAFANLPVGLPLSVPDGQQHAYHLFSLQIDKARCGVERDEFLTQMKARNIGVGVHYQSIPEHPVYQERFGWRPEDFPNAYAVGRGTVSLPLSPALTESDVDDVIAAVKSIVA